METALDQSAAQGKDLEHRAEGLAANRDEVTLHELGLNDPSRFLDDVCRYDVGRSRAGVSVCMDVSE